MEQEYMKDKPILPLILSMSTPMMLSMLVQSLYNIIDSIFVARLGEDAFAAVSLVYPLQNLITALTVGFGIGLNARVAFFLGAGKKKEADKAASQGVFLGILHGAFVTGAGLLLSPFYLKMFTENQNVLNWSIEYAGIIFGMSTVLVVGITFEKIFQSVGKMILTMTAMMAGCVANITLDPLMIFGIGPFPRMEVRGAAVATTLGWVITLGCYLAFYIGGKIPVKLYRQEIRPTAEIAAPMYQVGIPAALNMALPSVLISALNGILAAYSQMYVVILGIYFKLQSFIYLPANGIVQGMRPIISYNHGAKENMRVKKTFEVCLELIAGIMCVGMFLCIVFPKGLTGLFAENQKTLIEGAKALRIISFGFVFSSVSVVCAGAMEALGKGMASLGVSVLRYIAVILPAAYLLSRIFGAEGVWYSFVAAEAVTAVISIGIWKKKNPDL